MLNQSFFPCCPGALSFLYSKSLIPILSELAVGYEAPDFEIPVIAIVLYGLVKTPKMSFSKVTTPVLEPDRRLLLSVSSFEKQFRSVVRKAGIQDFHFHDLRHTGATLLAMKGWTTHELMAQGGWSSAEMVARYANIGAKHLAKRLQSK